MLWLAVCFAMSFSSVIGGCSPFAVSAVTVSGKKNFLFACAGAALGYIIFNPGETAIRYLHIIKYI